MSRSNLLNRLYDLDRLYATDLDKLLHDMEYANQLAGAQGNDLIRLVDYLSDVGFSLKKWT